MKVSELGEFGIIDILSEMVSRSRDKRFASWQQLLVDIGDDCAAWRPQGEVQLGKIDALIENVHFTLDTASWREIGWKALAVNISDIAAMGGVPRYALVSLGLPESTEVEDIREMYRGMIELAHKFEVAIVGGNVSAAGEVSVIVSLFGTARRMMLTRSGARPGDKIGVTGYVGGAAGGLEMLTRRLKFDAQTAKSLREAFLHPWPRVAEGQVLVNRGVKAAIDISDGLAADLKHICEMSHVGARVEINRIPVHPAVKDKFPDRSLVMALTGGEDYELLFTASPAIMDSVKSSSPCPISVIGQITGGKPGVVELVDSQGKPFTVPQGGWDHFRKD